MSIKNMLTHTPGIDYSGVSKCVNTNRVNYWYRFARARAIRSRGVTVTTGEVIGDTFWSRGNGTMNRPRYPIDIS